MRRTISAAFVLAAAVVVAACAAQSAGSSRSNANLITQAEIAAAGSSNAYQLVERLRPIWLRKRGPTSVSQEGDVAVYVDGTRVGTREALRNLWTDDIESIQFLDAGRATLRFGAGNEDGAILVTRRK
jgi:ABC-type phosphate transport system substrate-binding protein